MPFAVRCIQPHHLAILSLLIALLPQAALPATVSEQPAEIFGWIERVRLVPGDLVIRAKLDTGADNSSLNAPKPKTFKRDGQTWVRFTVRNSEGVEHTFEKPVVRTARIRSASGTSRRHVVAMDLCLGNIRRRVEVNLADRTDLSYQMLIGRSYMQDVILVASDRKYTMEPSCDLASG